MSTENRQNKFPVKSDDLCLVSVRDEIVAPNGVEVVAFTGRYVKPGEATGFDPELAYKESKVMTFMDFHENAINVNQEQIVGICQVEDPANINAHEKVYNSWLKPKK